MADPLPQIDYSRRRRWSGRSAGCKWTITSWDGSGYPHGLAGDRTPLNAPIMAAANTCDAIAGYRTYPGRRPHGFARAGIARASDNHRLDASTVEVFAERCAGEPQWPERLDIRLEPAFIYRRGAPRIDRGTDYAPA